MNRVTPLFRDFLIALVILAGAVMLAGLALRALETDERSPAAKQAAAVMKQRMEGGR